MFYVDFIFSKENYFQKTYKYRTHIIRAHTSNEKYIHCNENQGLEAI